MTGVRARLEGIAQVNDGLQQINNFASDFHQVAGDLWQETFDAVRPSFQNEVEHYAPKKRGSRYRRTGRLKRGWIIRFVRNGESFQIVVSNSTPYAKWVVGSFDQRRNFQTEMHRDTGWVLIDSTVKYWFGVIQEEFQQRYERYLSGFGVFKITRRNR
jgi:hypothetical protein